MSFRLNPVSLPKGAHQDATDEFVFASFPQFAVTRIIDTGQARRSPLGNYHRSNLDIFIQDGAEGGYEYVDLTGIPVKFNKPDPHPGVQEKNASHLHLGLEPLPRARFRLHDTKARAKTIFQKFKTRVWYPVEIEDASGLTIKIERSKEGYVERIVHPGGLALEFQNTSMGTRLGVDLIGQEGTRLAVMRYSYDDQARLSGADAAFGKSWSYEYGQHSITSDDGFKTRTTHVFDDQGRVIRVDTGDSYKQGQITYHDDRSQATVTHGRPENGVFEKLWFDDQGRHFMSVNPLGEISYREFDDDNLLTAEIDANGNKTAFKYDAYGNISSFIDPEKREVFMAFDDAGNVMVQKDPAGNAWRYEYDDDGRLAEVKDPLGHLTNIINNDYGQPVQIMRHDGLIEFRKYDDHHRLTNIIDFNSQETIFKYDEFGRVTGIQDPDKNITWLHYDSLRGKDFTTPTRIARPDGVEIRRDYHPTGTIKSLTDGEGRTTQYRYGPYDVLEEIVDPKGNTLKFQYDSQERLTQVTNQLGLCWTFERDLAGRVIRETDFDGRTLKYQYDPGGRVIRRDNPDGSHLEYDYDKSGLLTELRAFAPDATDPETTTYEYDDTGALAKAINASATIELERDALGRVIAETTNGTRIESEIDCCGRRTRRTIGAQVIDYAYDGMGGLRKWQLNGHDPLSFEHNALGLETRRSNGQGFDFAHSWDAVGQLEEQVGNSVKRAYEWSRGYDPKAIKDGRWGEKRYDYDPNGQITQTRYSDGTAERFGYNKDLNLAATGDHDQFLNWQTSAAGVVRLARGPKGEVVKLEHDANGRVIKRTIEQKGFRPKTWTFEWNAQDQLIKAHCPDGAVWAYEYDPFGRRIAKKTTDAETRFIWDGDVVAIESVYADMRQKEIAWFYEPGTFRPLARQADGELLYILTDHLGTPKEMVEEGGRIRWAADHDTWGTVRHCRTWRSTDSQPDEGYTLKSIGDIGVQGNTALARQIEPDPMLCPIRFQGQWEDEETGLYYNRFRYYEPMAGQYISPDPIGVWGGFRLHSYVAMPHWMVDQLGLEPRTHITYRGIDAVTGRPYIGYASMPGANQSFGDVINYRYGGDFSRFEGSQIPREIYTGPDKATARGLEQLHFEQNGGLDGTANRQNPVGENNPRRDEYLEAADRHNSPQTGCCNRRRS